jgi:hypothetical protein
MASDALRRRRRAEGGELALSGVGFLVFALRLGAEVEEHCEHAA